MARKHANARSRRIPQTAGKTIMQRQDQRDTTPQHHFCPEKGICALPEWECEQLHG